jgi:alanyl-tRNA synthetase
VVPSNEGRGYVLRRILRRASRHGVLLGVEEPFIHRVADKVIDEMASAYPELTERRAYITDRIRRDEERFLETLSKGLSLLEGEIGELRAKGASELPGEVVFRLYDTFGFPVDLTEDILRGHGMKPDMAGFEGAMESQRERARAAWKGSGDTAVAEVYGRIANDLTTSFVGYDQIEGQSTIAVLLRGGEPVEKAVQGDELEIALAETPFYAESGGQVGDRGEIVTEEGRFEVEDTQKPVDGLFVHRGRVVEGVVREGALARVTVDEARRKATVRNHSGTHLLHAALRQVLGPQAMQKGSLVAPDRLRFDFTHDAPVNVEELEQIEDLVNEWIEENHSANTKISSYNEAVADGATAIFEEKYGDEVRVVSFGDHSTELCGGTHAAATGDIGLLKIVSETGIAAGVRRIEALTGMGALHHVREQERRLREAARLLKTGEHELVERVERLIEERKAARREIEELKSAKRGDSSGDLLAGAREIAGGKALAARVDGSEAKELRSMIDDLRSRLGSGVVFLVAETKGKVLLAVGVTKDLTGEQKAGDLVRELAGVVGGGGGGRPDFAQAGGKDASKIDAAIEKFHTLVGAA